MERREGAGGRGRGGKDLGREGVKEIDWEKGREGRTVEGREGGRGR